MAATDFPQAIWSKIDGEKAMGYRATLVIRLHSR